MKVGTLIVDIAANLARLKSDMSDAKGVIETGMRDMQRSVRNARSSFEGVIVATGVSAFARQIIRETVQAEQAQNRLQAVLRATGYSAGFARGELDEMAESMAETTQFDDEGIRNAQSQLLKFGNIHGAVFKAAIKSSADLAAFMGTDIPEAAAMIGKTLQSPTEGLMMMERQFGKLTDAEENHIKVLVASGRAVEAQNAVLAIWERKVGGAADLMNSGLTKATKDLTKEWNELLEALGKSDAAGGRALEGLASLLRDVRSLLESDGKNLKALGWETLGWIVDPTGLFGTRGVMERKAEKMRATPTLNRATELKDWMEPGPAANVVLGGKDQGQVARDILNELAGVSKDFNKDLLVLHGEYERGTLKLADYQKAVAALVAQQRFAKDLAKEEADWLQERTKWQEQNYENWVAEGVARANLEIALEANIEKMELENHWAVLSNDERERAVALHALEQQSLGLTVEKYDELVRRTNAVFDARKKLNDQDERIRAAISNQAAVQQQADESARIFEQAVANGIMSGMMRGSGSFAENLKRVFENAIYTAVLTPMVTKLVGSGMSGAGALFQSLGSSISTSSFGQRMGWSERYTDASDNSSIVQTQAGRNAMANAPGYFGMALAAMAALRTRESRRQTDEVFADYEGRLGGKGDVRAKWNPFGAWMAGETTNKEFLLGMSIPGLTSLGAKGSAMRSGNFGGGLGESSAYGTSWFDWETSGGIGTLAGAMNEREQNLIRNMALSGEQIARVNASLPNRRYSFGMEHTDWTQSDAAKQIEAERMQAIATALGRSIEDLTRIMSLSAEQFIEIEKDLQDRLMRVTDSFGGFVRSLPETLGITALDSYKKSLAISEVNSPLDRLAAARGIFDDTLARARGGDLESVRQFPDVAQSLLGIGRDVYASGEGFQTLYSSTQSALAEVMAAQETLRLDIIKDVPATILEASKDEIAELRHQTTDLLEALNEVKEEIRLLRATG